MKARAEVLVQAETLRLKSQCPVCRGAKYVTRRVAFEDRDFGKMFPCICLNVGSRLLRRKFSELPQGEPSDFGSFELTTPEREAAFYASQDFAEASTAPAIVDAPHILTLSGAVGTGKSHLLQAIGWQMLDEIVTVKYIYVPDWLDRLRHTFGPTSEITFQEFYRPYQEAQVLLLDDLGAEKKTDWTTEMLNRVVDYRYRNGTRMAVATNKRPWQEDARLYLGDRIADRIFDVNSGRVQVVDTGNTSYRTGENYGKDRR